jgi:hypothetical protein
MENINIEQLRKLIESNPSLFSQTQTKEKKKVVPHIKENTVLEIPPQTETVQYISKTKAKKLMEEAGLKRTRKITDEQRQQLLENLAKGREKLKAKQQEAKQNKVEKVETAKQPKIIKVGENIDTNQPIVKYVVKGKRLSNPKKYIKHEESEDEEESETTELSSLTTSESESDGGKIIRKIKKKIKEIKKVDNTIKKMVQPIQQTTQQPNKPVYNLWYR